MLIESLDNGLECVIKEDHFSRMVAIQCWVGTGSLLEDEDQRGMAHLMEHMLFKGTPTRAMGEISRSVEAAGGDINAYTTFDATVFYLTLSSEHAQLGVELLADAVFNSSFDAEELVREKAVVLEEIKRSLDSPASLVGRTVFKHLFKGTEAARPIIGYEEQVAAYSRDDLVRFHQRWYHPENMKLVVVGDFDAVRMREFVIANFGKPATRPFKPMDLPRAKPLSGITIEVLRGDYQQPRLELAFSGPELQHSDTVGLDVAAFALGAGDSSRLNRRLRDDEGVVNSIGCTLYAPRFGGGFEVSAFPVIEKLTAAVKSIARELILLRSQPVAPGELEKAKASLRIERVYQEETVTGQARSLGHSLYTSHKLHYDDVYQTLLEHTTQAEISRGIKTWLKEDRIVIVALVPNDSTLTVAEIEAAYLDGVAEGLRQSAGAKIAVARVAKSANPLPEKIELKPGITVVYRQNPHADLLNLVAVAEGGLRDETRETAGIYNAFAELLAHATENMSYEQLLDKVEGLGASLHGFSGKDSYGMKLQCLGEHAETMVPLFAECILKPVFPENQWEVIKRDTMQTIRSEADSPANIAIRAFQDAIFGEHPYRFPVYGIDESVSSFTVGGLLEFYHARRDRGPWTIGCVGPFPREWVIEHLSRAFANWQPQAKRLRFPSQDKLALPKALTAHKDKTREQTHIVVGTRGLVWGEDDRVALDVLGAILGGTGGRLFTNLRDKEALAYSVAPLITYGCDPGIFGAYIACSPEKKDRAIKALMTEFNQAAAAPPSEAELQRALSYIIGNHEAEMQRGEAQGMTMALMSTFQVGHDEFMRYPQRIRAVTGAAVQRMAARLVKQQNLVTITVGPS